MPMLHGRISIDLPSEPYPSSGRVTSLLRWIFIGPDPKDDLEQLAIGGLAALERILGAFVECEFDDVISVMVDDEPVFRDDKERLEDLRQAVDLTAQSGVLKGGFESVRVGLSRTVGDLHTVAEIRMRAEVRKGDPEVDIRLATRLRGWRIREDETPLTHRERVAAALQSGGFAQAIATARDDGEALRQALDQALPSSHVSAQTFEARVVAPGPTQVGRFRHLRFGEHLRAPTYRPAPRRWRTGAYDDPHVHFYYDPYHDLLSWDLLGEVLQGRWNPADVAIVHPDGHTLFNADAVPADLVLDVPSDAATLHDDRIEVAEDIPDAGYLDEAETEAGSPHVAGYGGEDFGDG